VSTYFDAVLDNNMQPVIEVRSVYDTIEDAPMFSGSEEDVREFLANNAEWGEVWFFITNGDGTTETASLNEFLRHV
jgi:hypothetical protein